ncbi:C2 domain-containing protein [Hordeum vulgare]|nr:C2 domain-containing protein [Hordeum vulgare]
MVINLDEKFKAQYAATKTRGGIEAVEEDDGGKTPRSRGKTNTKKEDKHVDACTITLHATLEGMVSKKNTREEKHRQDKEEQINAFLEIQRKRIELDAEKQAKRFEIEAEKQAKMLEIEATNAKTKAIKVALVSMITGLETIKVDLIMVSSRKRTWFEKMQINMSMFDDE